MPETPPDPVSRYKFAQFLFERDLGPRDVAPHLGCSHEHVRRLCLPFDDPQHRRPSEKLKQRIGEWSRGRLTADDWAEPQRAAA